MGQQNDNRQSAEDRRYDENGIEGGRFGAGRSEGGRFGVGRSEGGRFEAGRNKRRRNSADSGADGAADTTWSSLLHLECDSSMQTSFNHL